MNEDIITMLDEQIKAELGGLSGLAVGSKEHTEAIEGLAKLYRLRIDDSKAAMEYNMGQLLSIPFVLLGVFLIIYAMRRPRIPISYPDRWPESKN